ncbi:serine/threonine protein kinase [Pedobacter frigoris]|uniref:Serine/threonine protein kinase n=1 Tax=Pedobacter frigoris TaxID=2571272 RepID=A0A4U1CHY7_9SPHI|nr:serine/threonine-protein kinase [Pedobacter frigoris]TKC06983.1 serine/threonine protein kinase [Pedobacter frigoris]
MSKVFTITEGLENMGALRTGGQGSVYKGKRMGAIITAVKILPTPIHTENTEDRSFRNFKNEVEKLKKVNEIPNPNVVKILNSGLTESGSFPFIEMQYIEGPDLEELLKEPHAPIFTIRETIKLADQLANALAHCHRVGVKHGDIKSNNVKFNTDTGNYILLDFGLAIMSDEQRRSSVRHAGAVEFMAPEQHDGEMFFQTDVYSYGVILYELLAGIVPFPLNNKGETSRNQVMLAHMEKPVPDLLVQRRNHLPENWPDTIKAREMNVPSWLLRIIEKCLEKDPEKRFANGQELQEAFTHHSTEQIQAVPVAAAVQQVVPEPQANPDTIAVAKPLFYVMVLCLVALAMFAVYSAFLNNADRKQIVYADTPAVSHQDTTAVVENNIPLDTTTIKPIIVDTAVQQTNVDSLQKEFERQIGTADKPVIPVQKPTADPVVFSDGKKYQLPKGTLNFYEIPDASAPKKSIFGLWTNAKFKQVDEQNGFIYVTHTNNDGEITKGWLKIADLKEVQ